jgi:D-alanyl-D-alanine carboxypeptidase
MLKKYIVYSLCLLISIFFFFSKAEALQKLMDLDDIDALSAVAIDGTTGKILFAKNPHLKIPPASTTKLVTAMVVLDNLPLDTKVKISKNAADTPSIPPKLYEGEVYTVEDLLYLMLMKSSNQAAVALAEAVAGSEDNFTILMNEKVRSLGLRESHFSTASGLPAPNQYTTSYDLALILYEALKYPFIKEVINTPVKIITSAKGRTLIIKNTNHLLEDRHLKEEIIGGKTGFTRASKHCLVNAVRIKDRLIITSVLGAPKRDILWKDSKKLIKFSELVLENKVTPVFITTVVNTNILVSKKFRSYYLKKRRKYLRKKRYRRRYRRHKRHYKYVKKYKHRKSYIKKTSSHSLVNKRSKNNSI